jgi:hypothetical protein
VIGQLAAAKPLERLPTKEESERQIQEEAARREAEILAQTETRGSEFRLQRYEEQFKFREELREVLRTQGDRAGPDIDGLAKRYGYDSDPNRYAQAHHVWRYTRLSQSEKVKLIRSLELPESVILDFLSDDIHPKVLARNGPRNESEVRVLAAKQLLRYPLPRPDAGERPRGNASAGGSPARSQSTSRKAVVSSPR